MPVLGITDGQTSGAAVVVDGRLVSAINEERIVRIKMARGFPRRSIAEALRLAAGLRNENAGKPGNSENLLLNELGRVYALLGEREIALEILRTLMTGQNSYLIFGTPRLVRIDPCWSRLADDPRFDEILKAAKPL